MASTCPASSGAKLFEPSGSDAGTLSPVLDKPFYGRRGDAMSEQAKLRRRISAVQFAAWELHPISIRIRTARKHPRSLGEYREQYKKAYANTRDGPRPAE